MAEGFARAALGAGAAVHSAGSRPAGFVHPQAVAAMAAKGIDIGRQSSKSLAELPADVEWACIVTMGCGDACPQLPARRRLD
jgi:protein-tyrosine-phosphatase